MTQLVLSLDVNHAAVDDELENMIIAVLQGLDDGVMSAVDLVGVGTSFQQQTENLSVVALHTSERLDDGQVLTR